MSKILTSGIARLYEILAHVKNFPLPLRFAAISSGIGEDEARRALESSPFVIVDDQIVPLDELEHMGQMTIQKVNEQYRQLAVATYCKAGRPVWHYRETENITNDHEQCRKGFYQALGRPDLDGTDATPITAEATQRFFEGVRKKVRIRQELADHRIES